MQKYGFERELSNIRSSIVAAASVPSSKAANYFIAATYLGDWRLCARIIDVAGDKPWEVVAGDNETAEFGQARAGQPIFDVRAWPIDIIELLPRRVFWALLRASDVRSGEKGRVAVDNRRMANEFRRLMELEGMSWIRKAMLTP
jgi:hypothetical protein